MKSRIKTEIARRNGAKSRGPVSIDGCRRASLNALKHGLASRNPGILCLANEDPGRLDQLAARWIAKLQPRDEAELEMVHEIVAHRWRLQRSWAIETAALDTEMDRQATALEKTYARFDEPVRLAEAFQSLSDRSQSLELLGRYEHRLLRQFERALTDYLRLRELPAEIEADAQTGPSGPIPVVHAA
jgi:hypothetical protein